MKFRALPLNVWLHLIFFIVGIVSIIMLPITMSTYLAYAEEGYGVDVELNDISTGLGTVLLNFSFTNPGEFELGIWNATLTVPGNPNFNNVTIALNSTGPILWRDSTTDVEIVFPSTLPDYQIIIDPASRIRVDFTIYVISRDALVPLTYVQGGA